MFLRKETEKVKSGSYEIVPFCNDCSSYNIETIRTCKDCGSHNIKYPKNILDINQEDTRGFKLVYKDKDIYYYKCDICR